MIWSLDDPWFGPRRPKLGDLLAGGSPLYSLENIGSVLRNVITTNIPDAISEVAQTWEELERLEPELFEPILETRPGHVADSYPQDVSDSVTPEDDEVAHTWGHLARDLIGGWLQPDPVSIMPVQPFVPNATVPPQVGIVNGGGGGGNGCDGMTWAGGAPPKGYKIVRDSCGNGVLRKVRRRRRRRMLTAGDKTDIASIVSMVGKGQLAASLINRSAS